MTVHAFGDDVLADRDATAIAHLIDSGGASRREVLEATIARVEKVDPQLAAVASADFERALDTVDGVDTQATGRFSGVPTIIKDNVDLAGLPTREGCAAVPDTPATDNGPIVDELLAQGLVPLGKSRLPEFGLNASTEFQAAEPTRNPWDPDYSAGASSGGSAALVAAGALPIAHGNDGGGSLRIPAAACGLVGLKPTRGRLVAEPRTTRLPVKIVTEGVLTRSVRDTAGFFADAERRSYPANLPPIGHVAGPAARRLRIGVTFDSVLEGAETDDETRAAVGDLADLLSGLGHHVEEIPFPASSALADAFSHYWDMLAFLLVTFGHRMYGEGFSASGLDNLTRGLAASYRRAFYKTPGALARLRRSSALYSRAFRRHDVICSPVVSHTTPRLGYLSPTLDFETLHTRLVRYAAFTPLNNATGGPAIALPTAATSSGIPIGTQVCADHGQERTLLELAYEIEAARPWRRIQDIAAG